LLSQALQLKLQGSQISERTLQDLFNAAYQHGLLEYYGDQAAIQAANVGVRAEEAATSRLNALNTLFKTVEGDALDQEFPIAGPGGRRMTLRQWNGLPNEDQEYLIYADSATRSGEAPMSKHEFQLLEPTEKERFLRRAMEDPALMSAAERLAKAESTTINLSPYERTRQTQKAMTEADVESPDFVSNVIKDAQSDTLTWMRPPAMAAIKEAYPELSDTKARELAQRQLVLEKMDSGIRQVFREEEGYTVRRAKDGWRVNGKLRVRNPYYGSE